MKEKRNRKYTLAITIMLVAAVLIIAGGAYAFILTQAGRNEEQKLTVKSGNLALTFEDNDDGVNANITLGDSYSKELKIKNTGTESVTTNMLWSGLVNTYLEESLSYTLEYKTAENGNWQAVSGAHTTIPHSDTANDYNLATDLVIPTNATYYYKVTITFNDLPDINQESDKVASLRTKFRLGEKVNEVEETNRIDKIIASAKPGNPTFANVATTDEGVYSLEDDYGTSYYYRGAVENNYFRFGGFYWRIVRINGDGSIRMIYDGTRAWPNGKGQETFTTSGTNRFTHINTAWNKPNNDAKYVGWMFGGVNGEASTSKEQAQANETNSNLKTQVDAWYKAKIVDRGLSKYVSDEIFCNDRSTPGKDATGWDVDKALGYGMNATGYGVTARTGAWHKDASRVQPKFTCEQKNDAFTVSDTTKGNGTLTYPVGLITADEILAAGGIEQVANHYYYLYKTSEYWYWSLSPRNTNSSGVNTSAIVGTTGYLDTGYLAGDGAVAPVINIAPEYARTLIGLGTMDSPYQIPGA